ncbi:hypothetical protein PUN28_008835 [Cardiocondyla obscurior]|uniref:Guided entry of tail-anchored proteins factor 1 n=1 Tax=Cardiocondyla obscurior TaxID=286306 RepID=A0AAW2FU75_9HYME
MDLFIIATASCILDDIAPFLIKFVFSRVYVPNRYDVGLQKELSNLKEEMAGISMVDEFARYIKLLRRSNNVEGILVKNVKQRTNRVLKLRMLLIYVFRALNGILILRLLYMYKNEPVIILPKDILWPIQNLLSWPCQHENAISLLMWLSITRLGISAFKKLHT